MKKRLRKKMSKEWEWYAVKVLIECNISENPSPEKIDENYSLSHTHKTYEESIILVKAPSFDQAYITAEKNAKGAEVDYLNQYDEIVEWKFVESLDCFKLSDERIQSGTELYSRFLHVPRDVPTEKVIAHYYPETVKENVVDHNFILGNSDFNTRPNSK